MRKNKILMLLILAAMVTVFGAGLIKLFLMRFGVGDVHPPYSTLRSDPLGSRVFYEALDALPAITVKRNHRPLVKRQIDGRSTLIFMGVDPSRADRIPRGLVRRLDRFIASGGRLLVAFHPQTRRADSNTDGTCPGPQKAPTGEKTGQCDTDASKRSPAPQPPALDPSGADPPVDGKSENGSPRASIDREGPIAALMDHWGIRIVLDQADQIDGASPPKAYLDVDREGLPPVISWHTLTYFDQLADAWRVVYRCGRQPVVVFRRMGKGSLVLVADAYLFSNEAMRAEPLPMLLSWLIGPHRAVVFDETHHGIIRQRGVMYLIRQYDLHWVFLGLIALAGLFVWKQSVPLVPPASIDVSAPGGSLTDERDSFQGMISLLQRHIPLRELLPICVSEWEASRRLNWRVLPDTIQQMKARLSMAPTDPVNAYRAFCQMLKRKQL